MKHNYVPDGCFLLARQIFESAIWRDDPHVLKLFIYLIGKARHKEQPKKYPGFEIKQGEMVTSLAHIAEDNEFFNRRLQQWSRSKVSRMLSLLKDQGYIEILADTYGTHISICNYSLYQDLNNYKADSSETVAKRKRNGSETQVSINKNEKKDKNVKKEPLADFNIFYKAYPKKKNKGQAEKTWIKISPTNDLLKEMLAGIRRAKVSEDWLKDNGTYIPHPSSWLNNKGWEDEVSKPGQSNEEEYEYL